MATTNKKATKGRAKPAELESPEPPRPGVNVNDLVGKPGPGPKVGDSAFQSSTEDHLSKGRPTSDSDGTNAGSEGEKSGDGKVKKKAKGPGGKVKFGDMVAFVTDGRVPGKFRPAVVIRPVDPELENADLAPIDITVFPDSGKFPNNDHLGNVHFREGVLYDENGTDGTWHFLDETDAVLERKEKATNVERAQEKVISRTRSFGR